MSAVLTHLDLFSGIGGFALAAKRAGFQTVGFSEVDNHASKVLKKHWPGVQNFGDIRTADWSGLPPITVLSGGFPCQPYSLAGKRRGADDDRALWPEMLRAISIVRPGWVLGENVPGLINMGLDGVLADLEAAGYACRTFAVPACAVDAKHRRERIWIVAHREGDGLQERQRKIGKSNSRSVSKSRMDPARSGETMANGHGGRQQKCQELDRETEQAAPDRDSRRQHTDGCGDALANAQRERLQAGGAGRGDGVSTGEPQEHRATTAIRSNGAARDRWRPEPGVGRVAHGIPHRVDRLKGLGNAIVPQVALPFFDAIAALECAHQS